MLKVGSDGGVTIYLYSKIFQESEDSLERWQSGQNKAQTVQARKFVDGDEPCQVQSKRTESFKQKHKIIQNLIFQESRAFLIGVSQCPRSRSYKPL